MAVNLTASQITALKNHDRQVKNLERIKDANRTHYEENCANLELAPSVPPERKMVVNFSEDFQPYLTRDSFVKVEEDFSAGKNRPEGYGYICNVRGVGAAVIYDVKFTPAYDGGRVHKNIHLELFFVER